MISLFFLVIRMNQPLIALTLASVVAVANHGFAMEEMQEFTINPNSHNEGNEYVKFRYVGNVLQRIYIDKTPEKPTKININIYGDQFQIQSNKEHYCRAVVESLNDKNISLYINFIKRNGKSVIFPSDCSDMFWFAESVKGLDFSGADTSNVRGRHNMFIHCTGLTSLNLRNFNTQNVRDTSNMFYRDGQTN